MTDAVTTSARKARGTFAFVYVNLTIPTCDSRYAKALITKTIWLDYVLTEINTVSFYPAASGKPNGLLNDSGRDIFNFDITLG